MSTINYHRGIGFTVVQVGNCLWRWEIHPPESVKGLQMKSGHIPGLLTDAIDAAKREIDRQDTGTI